jgi:hypothetical protein
MVDVSGFRFASLEHSFMVYWTADLAACSYVVAGLFREWWSRQGSITCTLGLHQHA